MEETQGFCGVIFEKSRTMWYFASFCGEWTDDLLNEQFLFFKSENVLCKQFLSGENKNTNAQTSSRTQKHFFLSEQHFCQ